MSRITDALQRAHTGLVRHPVVDEARDSTPIQLFAAGQPAVVSPWQIRADPSRQQPVSDQPRRVQRDDRVATLIAPGVETVGDVVRWPAGEAAEKLVVSPAVSPLARAQYGRLAAELHQLQVERGIKVVMLTSAAPGEGKSLTVANLALTFTEAHRRRVLLVDADLRQSAIHDLFGLSRAGGLSDLISTEEPLPVAQPSPLLSVLTAGESRGDPTEILTSNRMRLLLDEARQRFDWILLDTPPAGLLPDAGLLASMTDGVLLVAAAGQTPYDGIQRAAAAFAPGLLIGVVLNRVSDRTWPRAVGEEYYRRHER